MAAGRDHLTARSPVRVAEVRFRAAERDIRRIRESVFVREQGVSRLRDFSPR